jgi:UTP-glucose-1-phosphate uridylyltransferase
VLEEAVTAGIKEIGIIISETKQLVREYVERVWQSKHTRVRIVWFYQNSPLGVADALLCACDWVQDKPTAVLYPDEIHPLNGGISIISNAFEKLSVCWIGLTSKKHNRRQALFAIESLDMNIFRILGPYGDERTRRIGYATGRYILPNGLSHMEEIILQTEIQNGEELDDEIFFSYSLNKDVRGAILPEPIFDIGSPANWLLALTEILQSDYLR